MRVVKVKRLLIMNVMLLCTFVSASLMAIEITQVRLDKNHFYPNQGEVVKVSFVLSESAAPSLHIYDGRDWLVSTITAPLSSAGEHSLSWDGKTQQGAIVPAEAYRYTVSAVTESGLSVVHDLTQATAGEDLTATDIRWDQEDRIIEYRLPEPGRVNIRIGLKDFGPLMKTVIDWVPRAGGVHQEAWDGMDQSSVLDLSDHPNLHIVVDAFALGANTILVGPPPDTIQLIAGLDANNKRQPSGSSAPKKRMHFHSQQPLEKRGDVSINLEIPTQTATDDTGVLVLSGQVPIRMEVKGADRERVLERRFEPVFFVDGTFVFENEVGFLPFNWIWDTTRVNNGVHYVTANLRGYEGNFGMATIKVQVDNHTENSP